MKFLRPVIILTLLFSASVYAKCLPRDESYNKHVKPSHKTNAKSIDSLKKHLKCYQEKEVFIKLAKAYEYDQKYYLAALAYKDAGEMIKFNEMEKKRKTFIEGQNFNSLLAYQKGTILKKKYRVQKIIGVTSIAAGAILAGSGLGLFIHNKYGGSHSRSAQYSLMFGGMMLLSVRYSIKCFFRIKQ